jgi:hypothetical protein
MNRLDYGTQISFAPIRLSIGNIRKPTLGEIADTEKMGFDKFYFMEFLAKMTPKDYFTKLLKEADGVEKWESIPQSTRNNLDIFNLIIADKQLQKLYLELLNFFFEETVIYANGYFFILQDGSENKSIEQLQQEDIKGLLGKEFLPKVLFIIQQICGIYSEEDDVENMVFKNERIKQKYLKAQQEEREQNRKSDINMTIPNLISSVNGKHPSLNYTNIYKLTIYQLLDTFSRLQNNTIFDLDSTRVSVWGDEKKTFNYALWYKNIYDNKSVEN